ncbi:MAG: hypothetical protein IPM80_09160 [Proteobacteria bacterium]|nr:hypothetical protein [Pseudomonadota bacterium]
MGSAHWRIVLERPLAIEATEIYVRQAASRVDAEAREPFPDASAACRCRPT